MVELKAVIQLEDVHLAQAMNYLEAYNMEIGLDQPGYDAIDHEIFQ